MNNKVFIGVAAAGVIVLGAYLVFKGPFWGSTTTETPSQFMSLKDLRGRTGSQTCTFTSSTQNSQSQGTVYINNGMMRGNFTSSQNGQTVVSHMITKDDSVYVWSDGLAQGYKMNVSSLDTPQGSQTGIDANAPVGYDCKAGTIDPSVFELPVGITFSAVGTIHAAPSGAGGTENVSNAHAMQCQACDQAPDAATKAQCKAALQC